MPALLTLDSIAAAAPDGRPLFVDLDLSLGARDRVGLVGRNGSGKSTLIAIVAGRLAPADGTVSLGGRVSTLAQDWPGEITVADALGVAAIRAATLRADRGEATAEDLAIADWTLEPRIASAFAETELWGLDLDRRIATLSGGERTRVGVARLLIEAPDLILLDEPTNNLDADGRAMIARMLDGWSGAALIASHDRELLERVDRIVELSTIGVRQVGGGWSAFEAVRDRERDNAQLALTSAERGLKAARNAAQARVERQARRDKAGRAYAASGSAPKILLGRQAERAENSAGRNGDLAERQVENAEQSLGAARANVEVLAPLRIEIPPSGLPAGRMLLEMECVEVTVGDERVLGPWSLSIRGPERVALLGPNGAGKTSLLRAALGQLVPTSGEVRRAEKRLAMLDQHLANLDPRRSIVANYLAMHPGAGPEQAQAALARFAFRNRDARRLVGTLSGGERLRAGLACVLGGPSVPQLLILDEPTNHLDIDSVEVLEQALIDYDGAILVVSHDDRFLKRIGVEREVRVG